MGRASAHGNGFICMRSTISATERAHRPSPSLDLTKRFIARATWREAALA